jgi:hypothetical protein
MTGDTSESRGAAAIRVDRQTAGENAGAPFGQGASATATPSVDDIKALRGKDAGAAFDIDALGRLALVQRMLQNSLTVANPNPDDPVFVRVDWGADPTGQTAGKEIIIGSGGQQTFVNFQFLTIWVRQPRVDVSVKITNNANYACFYEVNKLLSNGQTLHMQVVNPWPNAQVLYPLDPDERLIVVPVGMHRYVLDHDPALRCIHPPLRAEKV